MTKEPQSFILHQRSISKETQTGQYIIRLTAIQTRFQNLLFTISNPMINQYQIAIKSAQDLSSDFESELKRRREIFHISYHRKIYTTIEIYPITKALNQSRKF